MYSHKNKRSRFLVLMLMGFVFSCSDSEESFSKKVEDMMQVTDQLLIYALESL